MWTNVYKNSDRPRVRRYHYIPASSAKGKSGGNDMNPVKIAAIVLIVLGVLGLVYGGFSYTRETHETKLGPIELSVKDKQAVNVPVWAGVGVILIGGVLLFLGNKRS